MARDLLEPAAAVAVGLCLTARLRVDVGRRPVTARHPVQGCGWCDWTLAELWALLESFDPDGPAARTFTGLRREHQAAMVRAAQAIPEPPVGGQSASPPPEPGWFDMPAEAAA